MRPPKGNIELEDGWLLLVSSVQVAVNLHDWKHRKSCFKNGRLVCRYNIPQTPSGKTCILPVYATANNEGSNKEILQVNVVIKKRSPFIYLTDSNPSVLAVLNCNNCTRYVEDQKVSLYYGAYTTKHNDENEKALAELMRTLAAYDSRISQQEEMKKKWSTIHYRTLL